ncbi:hypothetical protein ZWY2020_019044 [Hordeum vulgare]|nr:hypothetical protein ZWY2020_019044 [Hordeum vulgare]
MDGLIPLVLNVLKKKKAMAYHRSLSPGSASIDIAKLAGQDLLMIPQRSRWPYEGSRAAAAAPTTVAMKAPLVARSVMEPMPRETFSPRTMNQGTGRKQILFVNHGDRTGIPS